MTQTLEQNNQNSEFQKKQFMLMGGEMKNINNKLSAEEIKQITKNYRDMYFALTSINWGMGMTLGMAWQKALEQMDSFVAAKTKVENHPMNAELTKIHREFRRNMAKHIMTSEYAEEKLDEHHKKMFISYGEKMCVKSKKVLNDIYQKHMPKMEITKQPIGFKFQLAQQKTQNIIQQMILQQQIGERAA